MSDLAALASRLSAEQAHARRIAIRDLAAMNTSEALGALASHLAHETDPDALVLCLRGLAAGLHEPARARIEGLMHDPSSDVRVAHAARTALDRLDLAREGRLRPASGDDAARE